MTVFRYGREYFEEGEYVRRKDAMPGDDLMAMLAGMMLFITSPLESSSETNRGGSCELPAASPKSPAL